MPKRSTNLDALLSSIGVLAMLVGIVAAVVVWPLAPLPPLLAAALKAQAFAMLAVGVVSGVVFIAFGTVIRLLDEIRGVAVSALPAEAGPPAAARREPAAPRPGAPAEAAAGQAEPIAEGAAGFTVDGRTFKTRADAEAYLDLKARAR